MEAPHTPQGGADGVDGRWRKGGEFSPFYVPRPLMPQLDESDFPAFLAFAGLHGVRIPRLLLPVTYLRPHQRIDGHIADRMSLATLAKPLMASADLYILDGHHRWLERQRRSLAGVEFLRLPFGFTESVRFLFSFPATYAYGDGKPHPWQP